VLPIAALLTLSRNISRLNLNRAEAVKFKVSQLW